MKHTIQEEQVERFDKLDIKHFNDGWQEALKSILEEVEGNFEKCDCGFYNKTHISEYKCPGQRTYNHALLDVQSIISNRMGTK